MEPALHLVPSKSTQSSVSIADTASSLGLHDAMRYGTRSLAADLAPKHPLQGRLEGWEATRENLDLTLQRNMFGIHAPVRHLMERHLVSQQPSIVSFNTGFTVRSNVHLDILLGKDETIDTSDVLTDRALTAEVGDFHRAMEAKLRML